MRGAVPLGVRIRPVVRHHLAQRQQYIRLDVGIGVFVDRDGGCGVQAMQMAHAVLDAAFADGSLDLAGDIYHFLMRTGLERDFLHAPSIQQLMQRRYNIAGGSKSPQIILLNYTTPGGGSLTDCCKGVSKLLVFLVFLLALVSCPPSAEDEGPALEKGPRRDLGQAETVKPVSVADIDLAGTDDPELDEIAREVMDARGIFVPADEKPESEWMAFKVRLEAKAKDNPSPFTYWLLAGVYNRLSEGSLEAVFAARQAVRLAPKSSWAQDMLGFVLSAAGQEAEARDAYQAALKLARKGAKPPNALAKSGGRDEEVSAGGGRDEELAKAGGRDEEILSAGGRDEEVLSDRQDRELRVFADVRLADLAPAVELVAKYPAEPLELSALGLPDADDKDVAKLARRILSPQGYVHYPPEITDREWSGIAKELQRKLVSQPSALVAWLGTGVLLENALWGQEPLVADALEAARKAVELAPDSSRAHCILGIAYYFNKMIDRAIEELDRAVELDSKCAAPHFALADIFTRQENYGRARKELQAIKALGKAGQVEFEAAAQKLQELDKLP